MGDRDLTEALRRERHGRSGYSLAKPTNPRAHRAALLALLGWAALAAAILLQLRAGLLVSGGLLVASGALLLFDYEDSVEWLAYEAWGQRQSWISAAHARFTIRYGFGFGLPLIGVLYLLMGFDVL